MIIDNQGVWGFNSQMVPWKPVRDCIPIASYNRRRGLNACFFVPHKVPSGRRSDDTPPRTPPETGSMQLPSSLPGPDDLIPGSPRAFCYERMSGYAHGTEGINTLTTYRSTLFLDSSNPPTGRIRDDEVASIRVSEYREAYPNFAPSRSCYGGRVEGRMWAAPVTPFMFQKFDHKAHYLSLSMVRWRKATENPSAEDGLAPFITRKRWREEAPSALLTSSFCPASARAILVWGNGLAREGEPTNTWFDMYEF